MAKCRACGDQLSSPIYRTQKPRCYVFKGEPGDERNGLKFHTREGVVLDTNETSLIVPVEGVTKWHADKWRAPDHR